MTSDMLQQLGALMIPILVAIFTVPIFDFLQKVSAWLDALPPTVKRLIVALIVAVFNWLTVLVGIAPTQSPTGLSQTAVGTVLSALLAYLLHAATQLIKVKAAVVPAPPAPPPKP